MIHWIRSVKNSRSKLCCLCFASDEYFFSLFNFLPKLFYLNDMVSSDSESEELEIALSKLKTNNTFDGSKINKYFISF